MKKLKKFTALILSLLLVLSCFSSASFALEETETEENAVYTYKENTYPIILIHGLGGWGYYDEATEGYPYWGAGAGMSTGTGNFVKLLCENGYEAYAASVGPISSAWDRSCELFAQLTGTVVDYGEAHSKEHNHDRFGKSFEGNALMGEPWDVKEPLNLIGHSFGGPVSRLFTSLLSYGDEAEINATGKDTSPLFKGGHDGTIHSVTTLSGCHNGSQIANILYDPIITMYGIGLLVNLMCVFNDKPIGFNSDLGLAHFGLTPKGGTGRVKFNPKAIANFVKSEDNAGYDLTIRGSQKLNKKIKMSDSTYYYSISGTVTEKDENGNLKQTHSVAPVFAGTTLGILLTKGKTIDGIYMDEMWQNNDGIVPLISALYPLDEKDNAFSYEEALKNGTLKKGSWYYLDTIYGMDHGDYCGTTEDYPEGGYEKFWLDLAEMINR